MKKKLKIEDLVVASFETQSALRIDSGWTDPTPNTHCFVCGPTDNSCDSFCPEQPHGGTA